MYSHRISYSQDSKRYLETPARRTGCAGSRDQNAQTYTNTEADFHDARVSEGARPHVPMSSVINSPVLQDRLSSSKSSIPTHPLNSFGLTLESQLQQSAGPSPRSQSASPVPPDEQEVQAIRARALTFKGDLLSRKGKDRADPEGMDIVDMVLRLTATAPARTQVFDQASTIRRLAQQQEILIRRLEEGSARVNSEQESLQRVSEALVAQANLASRGWYKDIVRACCPQCFPGSYKLFSRQESNRVTKLEAENLKLKEKVSPVANTLDPY